jgi:hypothetical protein
LVACGQQPHAAPLPTPRAVDTAAIADEALVDAVLTECHAPLRGRMRRLVATVQFADGSPTQLFAELPDKLRVQAADARFLLVGDTIARLDEPERAPTAAEQRRVRLLQALLDAAAFGPLHRAAACRRTGPAAFALTTREGTEVGLELRPGTLLPRALRLPAGTITVLDYLHTPTSWVACELEAPELGRCRVVFDDGAVDWAKDFFALPEAAHAPAANGTRITPSGRPEPQSATPTSVAVAALRWAVVRDPGDWPGRVAAYRPLHRELERQNQFVAGFPVFWREGDEAWLAAPFRQRESGPAFAAPSDWTVRELPDARWLVVYPRDGDFAQRCAAGERMLRDALAAQHLDARGPITAQPYVHLEEGEPTADKLAAPTVRIAVRIE